MKISDYPKAGTIGDKDIFLVDGENGTRALSIRDNLSTMVNLKDGTIDGTIVSKSGTTISKYAISLGNNTVAGSRCFNIVAFNDIDKSYTLDSVKGLEVGDVFSLKLQNNYDGFGKITKITDNTVFVDNYQKDESSAENYFRVPEKPLCGTLDFGIAAFACGENCQAIGNGSYAVGNNTKSEGRNSYAEGIGCTATGYSSHAEGRNTESKGIDSHAEGNSTYAGGHFSHAEGLLTRAESTGAHAEGQDCIAKRQGAHAEGIHTSAIGQQSHSEGTYTYAYGNNSHAEGNFCTASGGNSHSEGDTCKSEGLASHSENFYTRAAGNYSHSEGQQTIAKGIASHSEGIGVLAIGDAQHAQGKYNIRDDANKYAHIIGNGTVTAPSNAHTLDWNGNGWFAGNIEAKNISDKKLILKSSTAGSSKQFALTIDDTGKLTITEIK